MSAHILDITGQRPRHDHHEFQDPYYGFESISKLSARFITHQFGSHPHPLPLNVLPLDRFIGYCVCRTKYDLAVTYSALYLLGLMRERYLHSLDAATNVSNHRLFLAAFMLSAKTLSDDTYSNKSYASVVTPIASIRQINEMEREMLQYIDWKVNIPPDVLAAFRKSVERDYSRPTGPYPTYTYSMPGGSSVIVPPTLLVETSVPGVYTTRVAAPSDFTLPQCSVSYPEKPRSQSRPKARSRSRPPSPAQAPAPVPRHRKVSAASSMPAVQPMISTALPMAFVPVSNTGHRAATLGTYPYPVVAQRPQGSQRSATLPAPAMSAHTSYATGMSHASAAAAQTARPVIPPYPSTWAKR